ETFLDELIAFLRAALPRLRAQSSSLVREAELAGAFARLNALAADSEFALSVDIAPDALHARFPPGVLLPLLHHAVGGGTRCRLMASRLKDTCLLVLVLGSAPADHCIERVRSLLAELYGEAGNLLIEQHNGAVNVAVKVPYELA
ncbi:MAG TPA: hypothetical protein VNQ74_10875, partial [Burkholderiaceae bacterium]|nr:hypothetical protein [Burkholderiaceae bacterium]